MDVSSKAVGAGRALFARAWSNSKVAKIIS